MVLPPATNLVPTCYDLLPTKELVTRQRCHFTDPNPAQSSCSNTGNYEILHESRGLVTKSNG